MTRVFHCSNGKPPVRSDATLSTAPRASGVAATRWMIDAFVVVAAMAARRRRHMVHKLHTLAMEALLCAAVMPAASLPARYRCDATTRKLASIDALRMNVSALHAA